jgi:hypothetical protein
MSYDFQLNSYVKSHAKAGLNFLGVFAHDQLPTHPPVGSSLIVNYSNSNQEGTHWVALMDLGTNNTKYFDSYGFDPDDLRLLLSRQSTFIRYLKRHTARGGKVHYNEFEFQALESDTCGEYAVKAVLDGQPMLNGIANPKWQKYIASDNSQMNDKMIRKEINLRRLKPSTN